MVRITEDLIRKRAEHNNMEISTLEEISLHQQDIERIEYIDKWCRDLKILYLQSNLIPKIENVARLKKLEYLNMALNNIEKIENLKGCESLKKLDLTVNFVGELTNIECLKENIHLRELFLTGNPCTQYDGYRDFVIATLLQLKYLDGTEIDKSERIKARQNLDSITVKIRIQEKEYAIQREKEKQDAEDEAKKKAEKKAGFDGRWYTDMNKQNGEEKQEEQVSEEKSSKEENDIWQEKTAYTPESRIALHEQTKEARRKDEGNQKQGPDPPKRVVRLMTDDGKYLNVNEAKVDFTLSDEEDANQFVLDIACYKHLDTSLLDVDVQPTYVKVLLKGKVLQLVLMEEVSPDRSQAQRSQTTGHLVITMPKVKQIVKPTPKQKSSQKCKGDKKQDQTDIKNYKNRHHGGTLEVDPTANKEIDLMVTTDKATGPYGYTKKEAVERSNSEDFIDDPDVPPLM